jgi:hypothetical protein
MTKIAGSGSESVSISTRLGSADPDPPQNLNNKFFCILLFEGTFTSFFKGKKSKRSHKTVEIKVFLIILAY